MDKAGDVGGMDMVGLGAEGSDKRRSSGFNSIPLFGCSGEVGRTILGEGGVPAVDDMSVENREFDGLRELTMPSLL